MVPMLISKAYIEPSTILLKDIVKWHFIQKRDSAIEDVVNEAIVSDLYDSPIRDRTYQMSMLVTNSKKYY